MKRVLEPRERRILAAAGRIIERWHGPVRTGEYRCGVCEWLELTRHLIEEKDIR